MILLVHKIQLVIIMGDVHVKLVMQEGIATYVLVGFTKNEMVFDTYAQVSVLLLGQFF